MPELTDAEVICGFMEERPVKHSGVGHDTPWWYAANHFIDQDETETEYVPIFDACAEIEKLGRLREVEERLTELQWTHYKYCLTDTSIRRHGCGLTQFFIHASAEQKTQALAAVIRGTGGPE
jgi:hypothetical protein